MQYIGAYLIQGGENTAQVLIERLFTEGVLMRSSPDVFKRTYRSFGVEDAHELRMRARTKPVTLSHRIFVVVVPSITTEAQNALLKTLEEPSPHALFFFIVPSPHLLLSTIRSRVQTLEIDGGESDLDVTLVEDFLKSPPDKRLLQLKNLYEHDDDEGRDIGSVLSFLSNLERRLAHHTPVDARNEALKAVYRARKYATDKGSLLKSLLEQAALIIPKIG